MLWAAQPWDECSLGAYIREHGKSHIEGKMTRFSRGETAAAGASGFVGTAALLRKHRMTSSELQTANSYFKRGLNCFSYSGRLRLPGVGTGGASSTRRGSFDNRRYWPWESRGQVVDGIQLSSNSARIPGVLTPYCCCCASLHLYRQAFSPVQSTV